MTLTLRHSFTLTVECDAPLEFGTTHVGRRRVIPITGGTVTGPDLTGVVLPGGADWNVRRPDGAIHIWARYQLRTADGHLISVINEGLGAVVTDADGNPTGWSCPTRPTFEVAEGGPTWLDTASFLGELIPPSTADGPVTIEVHRVLPA